MQFSLTAAVSLKLKKIGINGIKELMLEHPPTDFKQ